MQMARQWNPIAIQLSNLQQILIYLNFFFLTLFSNPQRCRSTQPYSPRAGSNILVDPHSFPRSEFNKKKLPLLNVFILPQFILMNRQAFL
jgi:hypothetical protein